MEDMTATELLREAAQVCWEEGYLSDRVQALVHRYIRLTANTGSMRDYVAAMNLLDDIDRWRAQVPQRVVEAV